MKDRLSKSISLIGILSTLAISILPLATSATNIGNIMMNDAGVVYDVVEAIDNKAWNDYVALQCNANKQDYRVFLSNQQNEEKHQGLFNVISAEIVELKELTLKDVSAYTRINEYQEQYQQLAAYYVGIDYDVYEETKYYFDGVNYNLVITAVEDGSWKIVEMSDAPIESLVPMGLGFNSINENKALNIVNARIAGTILNGEGIQISRLATAATSVDEHERPDYVRVYRTASSCVEEVDLYTYVKNVLPNEWIASWESESLKAGAMAVKMYGWYHTYHPKWSPLGADVKDTTSDQVYSPGTETDNTTAAINALDGIGLENSAGNIFETQYLAGTPNTAGTAGTGKISQWGSEYLAERGYDYLDICRYYYDESDKSSGTVYTFEY